MTANNETRDGASPLQRLSSALAEFRPLLIEPRGRRQASVALMLRERNLGLELLVIRRAENELDPWSGHMALPGGGREPADESVYDTARRETLEEIGVDLYEGRSLGRLDDVGPHTMPGQLVISTVVVAIDAEPGPLDTRSIFSTCDCSSSYQELISSETPLPALWFSDTRFLGPLGANPSRGSLKK